MGNQRISLLDICLHISTIRCRIYINFAVTHFIARYLHYREFKQKVPIPSLKRMGKRMVFTQKAE